MCISIAHALPCISVPHFRRAWVNTSSTSSFKIQTLFYSSSPLFPPSHPHPHTASHGPSTKPSSFKGFGKFPAKVSTPYLRHTRLRNNCRPFVLPIIHWCRVHKRSVFERRKWSEADWKLVPRPTSHKSLLTQATCVLNYASNVFWL